MARTQLQYGSQGNEVRELQNLLTQKGFYSANVDGIFGDKTLAAVKNYQKSVGLGQDGIVGVKTWGKLDEAPSFKYDDFEYDDYTESDLVTQAKDALETQLAQKPGYSSQWQTQLDDTINKILNREKFSYDLNGDALYQQYKDKAIQQGKMAMGDAIGQAAAMTGGYGNSYAQSVGLQMYQKELQNLNDIVPELYQMAYDKYNQEGQDLYNQYAMLGDRENMDYGRYRDSVSDWLTERDYLTGRYDTERGFDYGKYADDRNFAYGKYSDDKNYAYNEYRNAKDPSYVPTDDNPGGGIVSTSDSEPNGTLKKAEAPAPSLQEIEYDLNELIGSGASKSEINSALRDLLNRGDITQSQYNQLKEKYAPRGNTY